MEDRPRKVLLLAGRLTRRDAAPVPGLVERLQRRGLEVRVLCVSGGQILGTGLEVESCPELVSPWRRFLAVRRLGLDEGPRRPELIWVLRPDLDVAALALAEHWQIPYLLMVDEFLPPGGRLRLSRSWCRGLVAMGPELAEDLARSLGVPRSWITVAPLGIPLPERRSMPPAPASIPVIGAVSPLTSGSGLATFLVAARGVLDAGLDAEFVLAGEGPGEADLRRLAGRLGLVGRVTFAGTPDDGRPLYEVLDLFCQTSQVPCAGRSLATAMAHGIPVIAADVEGLRRLVRDHETGRLVPPGDPAALSRAILELVSEPARARDLGLRGREIIRR
ncbi:MAG: glycosyltransferase family 4 protein, partial [Isosphaeraceae bacterium]|nr:glycosyltransferase family 4 protein [Isosphaeraceae bacterium]